MNVLLRLQVCVLSKRVRAQSTSSLPITIALWPIFLAVAGLAVDLRLVRSNSGAVQAFSAAHCETESAFQTVHFSVVNFNALISTLVVLFQIVPCHFTLTGSDNGSH